MKTDNRNQNDQAPMIYRELSRQLRLPEQRIAEMEQQIRKKAAEKEHPAVILHTGGKRRISMQKLAYRIGPVAACALLVLTGAIMHRTGLLRPSEYEIAESEPEFIEQTGVYLQTALTTDADETIETVTQTVTVYNPVPAPGGESSLTAVPDVTEPPQTAPVNPAPAETAAPRTTAAPQTTAVPETAPPETQTEPPVTTEIIDPNAPPVVVVQETLPPPKIEVKERPEEAIVALDNQIAHPGETITLSLRYLADTPQAGFQFYIRLKNQNGAPLPEILSYSFPIAHNEELRLSMLTCNDTVPGAFIINQAGFDLYTMPAGTELLRLELRIPENVPVGTVYELDDSIPQLQEQKIAALDAKDDLTNDNDDGLVYISIGKIYIE